MKSDLHGRIVTLFILVTVAFLVLIAWQWQWHITRADWLQQQPRNPRLTRAERNTPRGVIFDCNGVKLAWSENGQRNYADPVASAAVLGYIDPRYGRTGVEGEWNPELSGLSRVTTAEDVNRLLRQEKPHGKDLVLTLDAALQAQAYAALNKRPGAVVLMDPETGGILALATYPTFDTTRIGEDYDRLRHADDGALRNRATQDLYPPGSTMKLVTASAALMHGVDPATRYTCTGRSRIFNVTVTDFHGESHGNIDMTQALAQSCNNYFARTAAALSWSDFAETARAYGFGQRWWEAHPYDGRMMPVAVTHSSLTPTPAQEPPRGERAHMGFGQSTVVVTPLQMAMVTSAIADHGTLMAPYLVKEVRVGGATRALERFTSRPIGFPLDSTTADKLSVMMRRVVTSGTARGGDVPGLTVYGKTGTAEQTGGQDHAWFIGYAEDDASKKRLAFAVIIERGGTGGRIAMPVARQVLTYWKGTLSAQ